MLALKQPSCSCVLQKSLQNQPQPCSDTQVCRAQRLAEHIIVIQQIVDNHDRVTVSRVSPKLCATVAGGAGGFLFCWASRHPGGGIAAAYGQSRSQNVALRYCLMMQRESLKGDLVKQQNLVRVADNSLGFGFD